MAQTFIQVPPNSTGEKVDGWRLPSGQIREGSVIGSPDSDTDVIVLASTDVADNRISIPVRPTVLGNTPTHHLSVATSVDATVLKASAGRLYGCAIYNDAAYKIFVKFYDKASAPVPGTDTSLLKQVYGVQAGTHRDVPIHHNGITFTAGISYAIVKGISNTDATAVDAGICVVETSHK